MKSGAVFGAASAIDGMIDRMEAELGGKAAVVATGVLHSTSYPIAAREIEIDDHMPCAACPSSGREEPARGRQRRNRIPRHKMQKGDRR